MEQTKALNALEPFVALTKSASSPRAASELITSATSAPNTYVFTPLLSAPQIQALATSEYSSHLQLLQIFTYGSYIDYLTHRSTLPALTPPQLQKLRLLTLLTLARQKQNLTYSNLITSLNLNSKKELEDLFITAFYASLLSGTLDPQHQTVLINSVAPLRDVPPASIPQIVATLREWEGRCDETLAELEGQIRKIREDATRRAKEEREWKEKVERLVSAAAGGNGVQHGPGGSQGRDHDHGQRQKTGLGARAMGAMNDLMRGKADGQKRSHTGVQETEAEGMIIDVDDDGGRGAGSKNSKKRGFGHH